MYEDEPKLYEDEPKLSEDGKPRMSVRDAFESGRNETSVIPGDADLVFARFAGVAAKCADDLQLRKHELEYELAFINQQLEAFGQTAKLMMSKLEKDERNNN